MGSFDIQRLSAKTDAVQVFQVIYKGSADHAALLDIYVNTVDPVLPIKVGRPGSGIDAARDTSGRAKLKIAILGDEDGATELPDGAALVEYVSTTSVSGYVGPRLASFLARVHGQALTS